MGHELLIARPVFTPHGECLLDSRKIERCCLDLCRLQAVTTDFDLKVFTSKVEDATVWTHER
jgi:hypothetical protein